MNKKLKQILVIAFLLCVTVGYGQESITDKDAAYREMARKAAVQAYFFKNFRSFNEYRNVLELLQEDGGRFADYILHNASKRTREQIAAFQKLEAIGKPVTTHYQGLGDFSGTTLRYIVIADQIERLFDLPSDAKIVEIGGGFGGQCYILSLLQPFSKYYVYDLPEPEALIEKMMAHLKVEHVSCLPLKAQLPEQQVDLLISNYAFSECDRATQLDYFERVLKKAKRGYIIYNQTARRVFGLDSLSIGEFITLLEENGMHPKVHGELISTAHDNFLVIWD